MAGDDGIRWELERLKLTKPRMRPSVRKRVEADDFTVETLDKEKRRGPFLFCSARQ